LSKFQAACFHERPRELQIWPHVSKESGLSMQHQVTRTESGHNQVSVESAMQLIEQMEKTLTPRQMPVQRVSASPPSAAARRAGGGGKPWPQTPASRAAPPASAPRQAPPRAAAAAAAQAPVHAPQVRQPPTAQQPEHRDEEDDESMSAGAGHSHGDMNNMPQQRNLGLDRDGRGKRNCNLIRPQSLRVVDSQVSACFFFLHSVAVLRTVRPRQVNGAENVHPSARKCKDMHARSI
jgi:hypothetical protein